MGFKSKIENGQFPFWFVVLERFGFPVFMVLVLIVGFYYYNGQVRQDSATSRTEFIKALNGIQREQRTTNEKLERLIKGHR